jgi:putative DNA primase/helicase
VKNPLIITELVRAVRDDIEKLDEALAKLPGTQLVIIDPISAYMGHVDTHRDAETRRVLTPLAELAARRRVAVVGVMHLRKGDTSALLRVSGSIAFVAAARCVWGFGQDPDVPENRVMVAVKNNLAALGNGLAYRIEAVADVPRVMWQQGTFTLDANSVLSSDRNENRSGRGERKSEAEAWLHGLLASGEEMFVSKIIEAAGEANFAWRTIERVKKACGVRVVKKGRNWAWVLA